MGMGVVPVAAHCGDFTRNGLGWDGRVGDDGGADSPGDETAGQSRGRQGQQVAVNNPLLGGQAGAEVAFDGGQGQVTTVLSRKATANTRIATTMTLLVGAASRILPRAVIIAVQAISATRTAHPSPAAEQGV
jgi:hypothetical protein